MLVDKNALISELQGQIKLQDSTINKHKALLQIQTDKATDLEARLVNEGESLNAQRDEV